MLKSQLIGSSPEFPTTKHKSIQWQGEGFEPGLQAQCPNHWARPPLAKLCKFNQYKFTKEGKKSLSLYEIGNWKLE